MTPSERAELSERRDTLAGRLEAGYHYIERAKGDGTDGGEVYRLETAWIRLLRQYEGCCDALDRINDRRA